MGQRVNRTGRAALLALVLGLAGCVAQYQNHGYIPPAEDLQQITVGVDTRETVAEVLGTPATSGVLREDAYYYVRSRMKTVGPLRPELVEREVLAVSFNSAGTVTNIERFGLERGQVVPISRRVTSSSTADKSFVRQLLGNLGRFSAENFIN